MNYETKQFIYKASTFTLWMGMTIMYMKGCNSCTKYNSHDTIDNKVIEYKYERLK